MHLGCFNGAGVSMQRRLLVVALLGLVGCDRNESGHLAATHFGDLSHPAERGSPLAALTSACGDGALMPAGEAIVRRPYLQQVTAGSAMVGWVSLAPPNEGIQMTAVDGTALTHALGVAQLGTLRSAGEKQVWAKLTDLAPDTIYCYALATDAPMSARTGMRTAPSPTSTKPIRFLAFGDSGGGGTDQYALAEKMLDVPYELIIHTGDVAYDDGSIQQFEDNVFGVYADIFKNIPFFPAAGNHDYGTMQGAPFRDVFALPGNPNAKWYSYDWGRIHFVALDTEADYETQAAWLDADLAASPLPWKIVYLHRPPYSSGNHGSDTSLRRVLAPIFEARHVQLVLAGHDHHYERTKPQNGVNYVVTGGGGRGVYSVGSSSFTAFSESVIHFSYVEVGVDELILHAIDGTGVEFDSLVVPREPAS